MTEKIPVLLVVDDRPDNLFVIEQLVNEYIPACIIHTAANADIAVEIALKYHPDGILSDIQMPGKNGIELCRQLKQIQQTSHIPVLLITAHESDPDLRIQGLEAGADDFIARPIDNLELAARIKVMFRIKHMQDELIEARDGLEKTVKERTENLQKANDQLKLEIEERELAENALRENEEKYRTLFERNSDAIFISDPDTTNILDANEATSKMYGYTKDELIGMSYLKLSAEVKESVAAIEKMRKDSKINVPDRLHCKKDGTVFPIDLSSYSITLQGKNVIYAVIKDISKRRQAEKEKQELEIRLKQAQKMEAIGTLAGGIAHDFNNILGVIIGYADLAKEDAPLGTIYQKDLDKISLAGHRAKDLVKQILAFSRQVQLERLPIQVQPLIKEGLNMLRSSIPTTISITKDIDPKCGVILGDPTQIHQIIMNLCTNAYHAIGDSAGELSITLKTTFIGTDNQKMLLHVPVGEYVEFMVSDTGVGIGPDVIEKVFDPYFTTKEMDKGTGMGLAIIHGIMKDYGGAITVESQLGKGATFHVYFPVVEKDAVPETKESEDFQMGKEHILFIDDEELLAELGKDMLERLGYHVTARRSSLEALEAFQNTPNEFDMVITDQTMPGMTGSDLARRMMQIRPNIPIILCTGYSNLIDEDSAKVLGIKEFALKPLTKGVLSKLIRKVLDA